LTQSDEKFRQAADEKVARTVAYQQGNLRLLHTENFRILPFSLVSFVFRQPFLICSISLTGLAIRFVDFF